MHLLLAAFLLLIPNTFQQPEPNTAPAKTSISKGNNQGKANDQQKAAQKSMADNIAPIEKPATKPEQASNYDARHDTLYRVYLWFTIVGVPLALIGIAFSILKDK